jgi:ferric-dicitrate binding protein FerR (iron transport regulator)
MKEEDLKNLPKEFQDIWDAAGKYSYKEAANNEATWDAFVAQTEAAKPKIINLSWIKYAAAAVILIVAGVFAFNKMGPTASEACEFATTYGQYQTVELGDGTKVDMAPNSKLTVSASYGEECRNVELIGQANFTVKRNESCPFNVKTGDVTTTVLGTVFEVRYDNKRPLQVAVHSGKVKVANSSSAVIITKDQSAVVENGKVNMASTFSFDNWNGVLTELVYKNASLKQIQADVLAASGKTLQIPADKMDETFTGKFDSGTDVETICKVLTEAFGFTVVAI